MNKETAKLLKSTSRKVEKAREVEAQLWAQLRNIMREAYEDKTNPTTYIEIGDMIGLTKARVYQLISGKRSGRKTLVGGDGWSPELREQAEAALAETSVDDELAALLEPGPVESELLEESTADLDGIESVVEDKPPSPVESTDPGESES